MKVLTVVERKIPEANAYLKSNEERMKLANRTNAYGGGGSFGWAPNLQRTAMKQKANEDTHKKSNFKKRKPDENKDQSKKENKIVPKC